MPELEEQQQTTEASATEHQQQQQQQTDNAEASATSAESNSSTESQTEESNAADVANAAIGSALATEGKISFSAMRELAKGGDKEAIEKKLTEQKKKLDEKNPEGEQATEVAATTEKKVETPAVVSKVKTAQAQKLAELKELGVAESDIPAFMQMSSEAFAKVKPTILKAKQLEQQLAQVQKDSQRTAPIDSITHPEGYLLDSRYKTASAMSQKARSIKNHWIQQLEKIEAGEDWESLDMDPKTGEIFIVPGGKANVASAAQVKQLLNGAIEADYKYGKELETIVSSHKQQHTNDLGYIKQLEDKFFPNYDDENHDNYKKTIAVRNQAIEILPEGWRGHPLAKTYAKVVANNAIFFNQLTAANKQIAELQAKLKAAKPASGNSQQPAKDKFANSNGQQSGKPQISMKDFHVALGR